MRTKEIVVNGRNYQLRKMDPVAGSFIYLRMLGTLMLAAQNDDMRKQYDVDESAPKPTEEQRTRVLISGSIMRGLSFEDTRFAHQQALQCVSESVMIKDQAAYIPVMTDTGHWSNGSSELTEDGATVQKLVIESLVFSLQPFFVESKENSTA